MGRAMNEDEDAQEQIVKDANERVRDFSKLSAVKKCPRCNGELTEGYLIYKRDSYWNENKPGFLKFAGLNESLTWKNHAFPSLRCRECHFVTFDYTKEVEGGTVRE